MVAAESSPSLSSSAIALSVSDSGTLELGVVTADGLVDWGRVLTKVVRKHPEASPFVKMTHGRSIELTMKGKHLYELDGGTRDTVKRLQFELKAEALRVMVPRVPDESATS